MSVNLSSDVEKPKSTISRMAHRSFRCPVQENCQLLVRGISSQEQRTVLPSQNHALEFDTRRVSLRSLVMSLSLPNAIITRTSGHLRRDLSHEARTLARHPSFASLTHVKRGVFLFYTLWLNGKYDYIVLRSDVALEFPTAKRSSD